MRAPFMLLLRQRRGSTRRSRRSPATHASSTTSIGDRPYTLALAAVVLTAGLARRTGSTEARVGAGIAIFALARWRRGWRTMSDLPQHLRRVPGDRGAAMSRGSLALLRAEFRPGGSACQAMGV